MSPMAGEVVTEAFEYDGGRQVTVYLPPDAPESVIFAADGGWHLSRLRDALEGWPDGPTRTMVVGVHGQSDDDGRLHEYVPGFDQERFVAHERFFLDVGPWVESRFGVSVPAEMTAVWGASLGGEFALAMALRHPEVFGVALSASPGGGYRPPAEMPGPLPRAYLVAGRQEQFFLDNATRWADALRDAGAQVVMMERDGEHGGAFWFEEFPLMEAWAFPR